MSAKWVRSQQWDDRHLTGALWPVKVVLRTFSHISTAVFLLSLVALYGILASVPIGLLARTPTVAFYAATFLLLVAAGCILPVWAVSRFLRTRGASRGLGFTVGIVGSIVLFIACAAVWWLGLWPYLRYDAMAGSGVRFFGAFIDRYQAVQFRRLPIMEMSELEFYSWWPLRVVLLLFVTNLVVATIRRIEFTFPRIGVLTVHTGIVTIALGSIYYSTHKQEGDVLLLASMATDDSGKPILGAPGRAESGFYDNTRTALWVTQVPGNWEQRPLGAVPRYNDYNLDVVPRAHADIGAGANLPPLDITVPDRQTEVRLIDDDISFRVVGYASYCEFDRQWVPADRAGAAASGRPQRMRALDMAITTPMPGGGPPPEKTWELLPDLPAQRFEFDMFGVEYTIGLPEDRWKALTAELPAQAAHGLIVEHPASGFRAVYGVQKDQTIVVGETGFTLTVKSLFPSPPMPLVTKGYEGATSSLAIVRVEPPATLGGAAKPAAFDRWIYSRFPEISQDMAQGTVEGAMPKRSDADPALRITYIDASRLNVHFDEKTDGTVRAVVRSPGAPAQITENLKRGDQVQIAPMVAIRLGDRSDSVVRVEVPFIIPDEFRERDRIGNHQAAAVAVQVRCKSGEAGTVWVPFTQYLGLGGGAGETERTVRLPDGRSVTIAFGRVRHEFWPPMTIRLQEFEMIPYEHSETPKDYRSDLIVTTKWAGQDSKAGQEVHRTSLNNPLLVATPYVAPEGVPAIGRVLGKLMSLIAPNQYKFSQAGWDQAGWRESQALVAAGQLDKPRARFTILGVGNNPGIYIIATGAIMMSVGIPWAFYLKPWLMQREKRKIQERLAREKGAGTGKTATPGLNGTGSTHETGRTKEGANT